MAIHFAHAIDVAAPPAQVFAWLDDVGRTPRWFAMCTGLELLDTPIAPGSRLRYAYARGSRSGIMEGEVTARVVNAHLAMRYGDKLMSISVDYRLAPCPGGTRMTHTIELTPLTILAKLLAGFIGRVLPGQTITAMERLRDLIEGR